VQVSEAPFKRAYQLWDDPEQGSEPPFEGFVANNLLCYAETMGLPGSVKLTSPTAIPCFTLDSNVSHPFAIEQRDGVWPERVLEWLVAHYHKPSL
jgi:hypothetical protein